MNTEDKEIINELVEDLSPVQRLMSPVTRTLVFLVPSLICLTAIMWYLQPFRPGFLEQILNFPRFSLEIFFGYAAAILAIAIGFIMSVPGAKEEKFVRNLIRIGVILFAGVFLYSLSSPSMPITMAGKRGFCIFEVAIFGGVLAILLIAFHRRSVFFKPTASSLFIGIGCALLPAITMQLACMYNPQHALTHHYGPILVVTAFSIILGRFFLKKA